MELIFSAWSEPYIDEWISNIIDVVSNYNLCHTDVLIQETNIIILVSNVVSFLEFNINIKLTWTNSPYLLRIYMLLSYNIVFDVKIIN